MPRRPLDFGAMLGRVDRVKRLGEVPVDAPHRIAEGAFDAVTDTPGMMILQALTAARGAPEVGREVYNRRLRQAAEWGWAAVSALAHRAAPAIGVGHPVPQRARRFVLRDFLLSRGLDPSGPVAAFQQAHDTLHAKVFYTDDIDSRAEVIQALEAAAQLIALVEPLLPG